MIERLPELEEEEGKGSIMKKPRGQIEFKEVFFTYPSRPDSPVLRGFGLKIKTGQTAGLVGGSGSGKSTTISLLQRFYNPDQGTILMDGHDIRVLQLKWFRSQMGLVSQEPVLFATSIKENILFGNQKANMDQVVAAAKTANAHDFIVKLPYGYDTHVGHFGFQMSGGQKQRIAIARAVVRDPKILLLDEATSALDAQSERQVQEALDEASVGRTTIIVAHRLATLRRAQLIAVIQEGKVVESGTHEELKQMRGIYSTMLDAQKASAASASAEVVIRRAPITSPASNIHSPWVTSSSYNSPSIIIPSMHPSLYNTPALSGNASLYDPEDDIPAVERRRRSSRPSLWRLMKMNLPEWRNGFLACAGAVMFGSVYPIYSYSMGTILSSYFLRDDHDIRIRTRTFVFVFLGLALLTLIGNVLQHHNFAIMGERLTKRIRMRLLEKILSFEIGWFDEDENSSAAVCARLAGEANLVRSLVGDRLSLVVQATTTAALALCLSLAITWRLTVVIAAVQPLIISSYYMRKVLMTSMSRKSRKSQSAASQLAGEAVVNHRTITAFSSQWTILGLFEEAQEGPRRQNLKQCWLAGTFLCLCTFIINAATVLTFWYGSKLIRKGTVTTEHLFQVYFILMSMGKIIADAGSMTSDLSKGADAVNSVLEILDRETAIPPDDEDPAAVKKAALKGDVELKHVAFAYPTRPEQMIFSDLCLRIKAGRSVALVGESGSGKSTVIALIERFYDPVKGTVEIDGRDVRSYNLRSLRSHIALVSQEPTLFAGTIRDNIAYGKKEATQTEVEEAAVLANAHQFISGMENGYDTFCGERGVQLSGGQKQRIALARAMLKSPSILLLDEATSALDSLSEQLVQEALETMMVGRTCVVVAHRLTTVQKLDCIVVIKEGKVAEQGSHPELIAKGTSSSYYNLTKLQQPRSPYITNIRHGAKRQ